MLERISRLFTRCSEMELNFQTSFFPVDKVVAKCYDMVGGNEMLDKEDVLQEVERALSDASKGLREAHSHEYTLGEEDVNLLLLGIYERIKERLDELDNLRSINIL